MASQILSNISNVAEKAKVMTGAKSQKVADLAANTKDVDDKSWRITTDYGVKQTNSDDWLKVVTEDRQGPMLLEDHFAREKFIFTPELGVHNFIWDEALKIACQDPEFHRKDLWTAIENGAYPKWKFGIQVIPESKENDFEFDILDATKVWPEELLFCTSHVVPDIGFSDDFLLQDHNFSYFDKQLFRLGVNWQELPINKPVCPVMNLNRDGAMGYTITKGKVSYWPNRHESVPPAKAEEGGYVDFAAKVAGIKARTQSKKFREHKNQAELFYNSLSEVEQMHTMNAFAFELDDCYDPAVYKRVCERICEIDLELAQNVSEIVGADIPTEQTRPKHSKKAKGLSQLECMPETPTIATRMVAILIADGYDKVAYNGIKAALIAAGALPFTISTGRNKIYADGEEKDSSGVVADHHLGGMRLTMFNSVFVHGGAKSVETLCKNGRAVHWVREAFSHLKAVGATGEAVEFVRQAVDLPEMRFSTAGDVAESHGVVTTSQVQPESFKEAVQMAKGAKDFVSAYAFAISRHKNFDRELVGLSAMVAY